MAYSAGFHPHPKISYANGAPTGVASEAEYFEISVAERVDPESVRVALDAALPAGLDVLEVVEAGPGSLADRLEASEWRIEMSEVSRARASAAVEAFLARDEAPVSRMFKTGEKTFDARGPVASMSVLPESDEHCAILRVVVRHTTPSVRPDDILTALHTVTELLSPAPPLVTRLAQGPLLEAAAGVADPLAADKDDVGT
jgi:radical SAM-linked protein